MSKIKELLKKFNLNLKLTEHILNLDVEGTYYAVEKDNLMFHYKKGFSNFDCFVFKGYDDILIIVPKNKLEHVVYRKRFNETYIGQSYNIKGNISFIA